MKKLLTILFACFSCFFFIANGQETNGRKAKAANKMYDKLGYKASAVAFEKQGEINTAGMIKLANAYRLNHDTENAELWYAQVVENSSDPEHFLHYAQALQSNGKYEMAKDYYLKYDEQVGGNGDKRGEMLAAAIDRMNEINHTEIEIKNESILNSDKLDFSPSYYNDGIVFVSSRGVRQNEDRKDIWTNDKFMALFFAARDASGGVGEPEVFSHNLTTKYHEGPVSFTSNGERIFFTRNHFNNGKRKNNSDGIMKLQIYTAFKEGEQWSEPVELNLNTVEHEECHPSVSPDGQKLFFASDRPGGFGGMDLYVSHFVGGSWTAPMNLGEEVNTAGNEVFPFIHDDGTLYFASNGLGGLGGLDIFKTIHDPEKDTWTKTENIGTPFNSPKDDFGFILNVLGTEGYLSSARKKGLGNDDIYSFVIPVEQKKSMEKMKANIALVDQENGQGIEGAEVAIYEKLPDGILSDDDFNIKVVPDEKSGEYSLKLGRPEAVKHESVFYITNINGEFTASLDPDKDYVLVAKKDGVVIEEKNFTTKGINPGEGLRLNLQPKEKKCASLEGIVVNKNDRTRIPDAFVTVLNISNGEEQYAKTNQEGGFVFDCVACNSEFVLKAEKKYFSTGTTSADNVGKSCTGNVKMEVVLELTPAGHGFVANSDFTNPGSPYSPGTISNNGNLPGVEYTPDGKAIVAGLVLPSEMREGSVIEIPNIYYDFGKHYIRDEDASEALDKVVALMRLYPGLVVELSSHTDSRGSDDYNKQLSGRRAKAAVRYIIAEGIESNRIIAKGYGEGQLRNKCADGIDCDEKQHQYNRRTEIKILSIGDTGVQVRYNDEGPKKIDKAPKWIRTEK